MKLCGPNAFSLGYGPVARLLWALGKTCAVDGNLDKLHYSTDQYSWYLQMSDNIWWNSTVSNFKQSWSMVWHWIYATNGQRDRTSTKMCLFFVLNRQRNHSFCPEFFQFFNLAYNYVPVSSGIQHIFFENPATKLAQMSLYKRTHQIIHLCCTIYVSL